MPGAADNRITSVKLYEKQIRLVDRIRRSPIYPSIPKTAQVVFEAIDHYYRYVLKLERGVASPQQPTTETPKTE